MKQVVLTDEEHGDVLNALEQMSDLYEMKANELEKNIKIAEMRIIDFRQSRQTVLDLKTKVTLADDVVIKFEMDEDEQQPYIEEVDTDIPTDKPGICDDKRNIILTDVDVRGM